MTQAPTDISVVIPFRNAAAHLGRCLEALRLQRHPAREIILVDNGSTDESASIAAGFASANPTLGVKVLAEPRPGASVARNTGTAAAVGGWIAFTDADCAPDVHWLSDLASAINNDPAMGAYAGCIRPAFGPDLTSRFLGLYTLPPNEENKTYASYSLVAGGGFPTANLCIRRDLFNVVGGFDERIRIYGEDHMLCAGVYRAGEKIRAITGAAVSHHHRSNLRGMIRQAWGFGFSHGYCMRELSSESVIIHAPLVRFTLAGKKGMVWIDLNQADKKFAVMLLLGLVWPPLALLAAAYVVYLSAVAVKRARHLGIPCSLVESPAFALLLILKSGALTCGRIAGSFAYRVLCI